MDVERIFTCFVQSFEVVKSIVFFPVDKEGRCAIDAALDAVGLAERLTSGDVAELRSLARLRLPADALSSGRSASSTRISCCYLGSGDLRGESGFQGQRVDIV